MRSRQASSRKPADGKERENLYRPRLRQIKPAKWQSQSYPFLGRLVVSGVLMLLALLAFNLFFE